MNTLSLATAAFLALAGVAAAQPAASPAADLAAVAAPAQVVGRWLHDAQGNTIGSVRALADGGQSAVVMLGGYFQPGSHEVTVPADRLAIVDGKVTLRTETALALNTPAR